MTRCTFDPSGLKEVPLGMFHCPDCACMVIAGLPHGACEPDCSMADDDDRAAWEAVAKLTEER